MEHQYQSLLPPPLLAELKRLEIASRRAADDDVMGSYRSAFKGSGLLFSDLREYAPGDDVKHIHWKASARTGKVYVKSYQEERHLRVILAVDVSRSTGAKVYTRESPLTEHEKALQFAALTSMIAQKDRDLMGLMLFSDRVHDYLPPAARRSQTLRILTTLSAPRELAPTTDLRAPLTELATRERRRAVIFIVSDFLAPPFETELRALAARHDVILTMLYNPPALPASGLVEVIDAESGALRLLDTSSAHVQRAIAAATDARVQEMRALAARTGADLIQIKHHPLAPLAELMRQRSRRMAR